MPTYILLCKLTHQGSKDIMNAPARIDDATKLFQKMGGKVIGVYMVMGEYDYITIGECPSDEVSTAFALALSAQGNVKTTTLKAFTAKEIPAILAMLPKS
ncbi:MAG TPA: GYD domain-containing protein [Candidatus Limnocylindria bacterium]|nr:GYD domain-containing protein [Candidatus Limnocylindria bacterium]